MNLIEVYNRPTFALDVGETYTFNLIKLNYYETFSISISICPFNAMRIMLKRAED